ncbi:sensor histidine kinase [Microbacterium immunditiarum]|uniref:histidine kinase n=1 Tax=Microbacterium immunditiarum TaxID=337480 RepID=A0A7Y9GLC7_9MICO|nr:nitrate- and nitrite sensing domain-containing protein [Microbacterium immunditiarum]NYE18633.1 signal transduction histidine kinase [Microbacterium immunditiarum]
MAEPSSDRTAKRRWWQGIRPRLIGVLLIPMIAALVLGVLRVESAVAASTEAARAESLANALPASFALGIQLTREREAANAAIPDATKERIRSETDEGIDAWRQVAADVDDSQDPALAQDLDTARSALSDIDELREQILEPDTRSDAVTAYTDLLNLLFGLSSQLPALEDPSIYEQTSALANVRTASEVLGVVRVVISQALMTGEISPRGLMQLASAQGVWDQASADFVAGSSPAAAELFEELTDRGPDSRLNPLRVMDQVVQDGGLDGVSITLSAWLQLYAGYIAELEEVIVLAADDLAADVADVRQAAQQSALLTAGIVGAVLLIALVVTLLATRSILRPLVRLRGAALEIAGKTLPDRVKQVENADGPIDTSVEPIGVEQRDEIGDVSEAFDAVHAEAVRLAGEQAQMRANVNRMFVNLSRRSQNLVERQLRLIEQLEAGEQDPAQLANLFQLDNLATRMRRNDESLLVLAGGDTPQAARGNVPVLDVLRAATSEIEQFARVEIESAEEGELRGSVAGDLVHLLAELIENATNFSPPDSPVVIRTLPRKPDEPLVVDIVDLGLGMTPDELLAANAKLKSTSGLDADVARMMGLVVTARLADRHGMTVSLRSGTPRGIVARVRIPASALATGQTKPLPVVAALPPRQPVAVRTPAGAPSSTMPAERTESAPVAEARAEARPAEPAIATVGSDSPPPSFAHDDAGDTPIFAALRSAWFTRGQPLGTLRAVQSDEPAASQSWSSPGDDGWKRAAEVFQRPEEPELVTAGGLPKRVPGQNLVPGAAPAVSQPAPQAQPTVDPRRSGALSSFQRGVSRARADAPEPELEPDDAMPTPTPRYFRSQRGEDE